METKRNSKIEIILCLLATACIPVIIAKSMILGLDVDEEYAVTLIYRIACGDRILKECFEPHCTSAILPALFAKIYMLAKGDTEYLLLYLRAVGLLGSLGVSEYWYLSFSKKYDKTISFLTAIFIFAISPKWIATPEFAGLEFFSLTVSLCGFSSYFMNKKRRHLVIAGIGSAIMLFSYPSTAVVIIATFMFFLLSAEKEKKKDIIFYLIPVAVCVIIFMICLLTYLSPKEMITNIGYLLEDKEHQTGIAVKFASYAVELACGIGVLLVYGIVAFLVTALFCINKKIRKDGNWLYLGLALTITVSCIHQIYLWIVKQYPTIHPQYRYLALIAVSFAVYFVNRKRVNGEDKQIFAISAVMSITSLLSVLLLTNLTLKASLVHGILVGIVAYVVLTDSVKTKKVCAIVSLSTILLTGVFGRVYLVRATRGQYRDIWMVRQKILYGAGKFDYPPYMEGYRLNTDYEWISGVVPEHSKVLYVGTNMMVYLLGDYEVCTDSTISTPSFSDNVLRYFDMNPGKIPEYVIADKDYAEYETVSAKFIDYIDDNYEMIGEDEFSCCFKKINR